MLESTFMTVPQAMSQLEQTRQRLARWEAISNWWKSLWN